MRWIFIEKNDYYLIQNPKTNRFLSCSDEYHTYTQEEIDSSNLSEYTKWKVVYYKKGDEFYVVLKNANRNQYLTAQNYIRYSPGQGNYYGYHMTSEDNLNDDDACSNDYLKWKIIELTTDQLKVCFNFM